MSQTALFSVPEPDEKTGEIYEGVAQTVQLVQKDPYLSSRLAGSCALALQLAREADNVNVFEKAYARTKLYDSLTKVLDQLTTALAEVKSESGLLQSALSVVENLRDDVEATGL